MTQRAVLITILLLLSVRAQAQEVITLTTPETVPDNTVYAIASVLLDGHLRPEVLTQLRLRGTENDVLRR